MTDREGSIDGDEARRRLHEIAVREEPLRSRVDDVLSLGVEYLGVGNGHVAEIDAESGHWEAVASTDPPEGSIPTGRSLELANTYCRHAIQRDHPFARHDVEAADLDDDPAYDATQPSCYHGAAITIDGDCFGTVCFVSADPRAEPFSDEEKLFVDLAATLLGHAFQRSRDERRVTERGRALAERAERLRSLVAASFDVVVQLDGDGTVADVAAAQRDLLGYEPDELRGRSYAALMASQEAFERASAALRRVRDGTPARELGLEVLDSDGRVVPVDVSAAPVFEVDASDDDALPIGVGEPEVGGSDVDESGVRGSGADGTGDDGSEADDSGVGGSGDDESEVDGSGVGGSAPAPGVGDLVRDGWTGGLPAESPDSAGGSGAPTVEANRSTARGVGDTDAFDRDAVDAADAVEPGAGDRDVAGVTVVLRDASRRQRYEHLVSVLQRVLRHNVRNALNVVHGAAEEVEPGDEASQREVSRIQATCADLLALSEKAGTLEAAIGEAEDPRPTDLGAVAERVADRVGERYPDAEATVDVEGRPVARATESLERAVEELVENAAKHGGQGVGVEIRARDRDDGDEASSSQQAAERAEDRASDVVLEVADDGPGLPDQERAVLTAGEESPLEHGSGLGHWFVYWIATSLGGTVEASVDEGTTVRLRLPGAVPGESEELGESK